MDYSDNSESNSADTVNGGICVGPICVDCEPNERTDDDTETSYRCDFSWRG